ncbi:cell division ATP-binding protein FtsE [Caryophanon tenue]|uniref:ABC transporter domain-containing protein n=1 Tax=Caryophanon tenue TaxID=33978 RepID=A0A1C0Y6V7_9BACL|nr:ABC transporter ATP-binding protein [Caryophanon tenue]OCS82892.1 hypothetical protein A6M13_05690 [Caryophanon tenue]
MIQMHDVTKSFDGVPVLNGVNYTLSHGEFAFLRGRSGSGKSTFLKLLYRESEREHGTILIDGTAIDALQKFELRRKMGIIFQSYELISQHTVLENVLIAGKALGRPLEEIEAEAMRLLTRVGLADKVHQFPNKLSGGQQQRVAIVRALLNKPKLLLADEPTGNLDRETAQDIMTLLYELHREEQMAMLIVTHSEELLTSGARVSVMEGGHIDE